MQKHVKSKQRVADHGEVLTPQWIVNAMLDLVKPETERIDSRFLEPACGTSNFLTEILERSIIWGDALTLKTVGEAPEYIVFSEWSLVNGSLLKRRDFSFKELVEQSSMRDLPLFSNMGEQLFIPVPVREFSPVHFLKIVC